MPIDLRYGCNPHQSRARLASTVGELPLEVLNGEASYINILDALTGWQLVRELEKAIGKVAAASFKHLSPAGAAVAGPVSEPFARSQFLEEAPTTEVASAYVRARGADRMSSFGDAAAVSGRVNMELAQVLKREVSDLLIAPSYEPEALEVLRTKRGGRYLILEMDPDYEPPSLESREVFGLTLEQERNDVLITAELFSTVASEAASVVESLVVATAALKYAQSNSVSIAHEGQVIGLGAGQQSRIHCTRLACSKAEKWMLQTHPKVLDLDFPEDMGRPEKTNAVDRYLIWNELSPTERSDFEATMGYVPEPLTAEERAEWFDGFRDLVMSSDAFIPFRDNVDRAAMTGVSYIAHSGGSVRDDSVRRAAEGHGVTVIETDVRCFLH